MRYKNTIVSFTNLKTEDVGEYTNNVTSDFMDFVRNHLPEYVGKTITMEFIIGESKDFKSEKE